MKTNFVLATPELISQYKLLSGSNATDFIRFTPDYFSMFALVDDRPAGLIGAKKRCLSAPLQTAGEVFIDIIEVLPEYQRHGLGTALLDTVITWARENQAVQVRAWSEEIRTEALLLWNKMGFTFSQVDFQRGEEKRYGFYVAKRIL